MLPYLEDLYDLRMVQANNYVRYVCLVCNGCYALPEVRDMGGYNPFEHKKKKPPINPSVLTRMLRSQCKQLEAAGEDKLLTLEVKAWWVEQKEEERIREEAAKKKKDEETKKKLAQFNKLKQELEMDGVI